MDVSPAVTPPFVARPLRLEPFRALRLAASRIGLPGSARMFARPYRGAAQRLQQWQARGLVERDDVPALYLHEYSHSGLVVRGLIGALDVSRRATRCEDRAILPHEGIYPAQADDLAARMAEMSLNPAPILLVQRSPEPLRRLLAEVRRNQEPRQFTDRAQTTHRQWPITDPATVAALNAQLAGTDALIADGHHRYAAYLRLQQRRPGTAADCGLAMVIDHDDTPLFLGAIHRLMRGTAVADVADAAHALGATVRATSREPAVAALAPGALVATDAVTWLVIAPPRPDRAAVEWLHEELVPMLRQGPTRTTYHHAVGEALELASPGQATAVLLPAPTMDQVIGIARAGRLLPEKATSFQPKPPFGIALRSLRDG